MNIGELHLNWGSSKYKGKVYRSYNLARSYRKDGKNLKELFLNLGKLSDEEVSKWQLIISAFKNKDNSLTTINDIMITKHYHYYDVAIVSAIWDYWGLDEAFIKSGEKYLDTSIIARILTINRCIDPLAKYKIADWFKSTLLSSLLKVNPDFINTARIFRELGEIEKHKEALCKHIFDRIKRNDPESLRSVFYDLSSTTFSGTKCILMKWGHCKEGYDNHIVLALVVNEKGLPFYWEILPGGTADSTTIEWLYDKLKNRFELPGITLVFDRGMVSKKNLSLLEKEKVKYISAMDKSQIESLADIDFKKYIFFEPEKIMEQIKKTGLFVKTSINNNYTYYREIGIIAERRYILCFNPVLFKDQHEARETAIQNFRNFVSETNKELDAAKKSRQEKSVLKKFNKKLKSLKLSKFVKINLEKKELSNEGKKSIIQTFQAEISINEEEKKLAGRLNGFWVLVTNHLEKKRDGKFEKTAKDLITHYREKTIIESGFRDIKSMIEVSPLHVWTSEHVKAHYTTCVLAYLQNKTITLRLHQKEGDITKDVITHESLYSSFSDTFINKIETKASNKGFYSKTVLVKQQLELLDRISLSNIEKYDITGNIHLA